jgi:GT2 family glycosyltransferase
MIELSIIILNYNTPTLTIDCLESIVKASSEVGEIEVIVVDNGSGDDSVERLNKLKIKNLKLKIVVSGANKGFAGGNNFGLKEATGKYILFLNSDTILKPDALRVAIEKIKSDPKIGAITANTTLANGQMDTDCHRGFPTPWASLTYFLGLEKFFPKTKLFGQYHQGFLDLTHDHEVPAGAGAFMLVPKTVIDQVGIWDEKYFFYGEDLDFFYRIHNAGYQVIYIATPLLTHFKGASSGLRHESKGISIKTNRIKVAKASIQAMEIFYKKFYADKYPKWLTQFILLGIKAKGLTRIVYHYLK